MVVSKDLMGDVDMHLRPQPLPQTKPPMRRFFVPLILGGALSAMISGCGSRTQPSPTAAAAPPSMHTIQHLFPKGETIVKKEILHFRGASPEEVVVSTTAPQSKTSILGSLQVSTITWNRRTNHWRIRWTSPKLALQQSLQPGHPVVPAVSAFKVDSGPHGALLGLLDPASIGADAVWNDGLLFWIPSNGSPKTLWTAHGHHMVVNGTLTKTRHGIRVIQDACSAVEAVQQNQRAHVKTLSCTDLTAETPGTRLTFTLGPNGNVHPAKTALTVSQGSTLVFWPANRTTAKAVNNGSLGLYGGNFGTSVSPGEVPLANADTLSHWSYHFTKPGTYQFAIVPNTTPAPSVPVTFTVTVTG